MERNWKAWLVLWFLWKPSTVESLLFFREIIKTFDISPRQTRVAIVEYSSTASVAVALDNYGSKTRLMCAVDDISYSGMFFFDFKSNFICINMHHLKFSYDT